MPWMNDFPSNAYEAGNCRSPTDFLPIAKRGGAEPITRQLKNASTEKMAAKDIPGIKRKAEQIDEKFLWKQHVLPIQQLTHSTHQLAAARIVQSDGGARLRGRKFFAQNFETRGDDRTSSLKSLGKLVWFACKVDPSDAEKIRENVLKHHVDRDELNEMDAYWNPGDNIVKSYATSTLFTGTSPYGNFVFTISAESFLMAVIRQFEKTSNSPPSHASVEPQAKRPCLSDATAEQEDETVCAGSGICFHVGGTLFHTAEVAYVVIVAAKDRCSELVRQGFPCCEDTCKPLSEQQYCDDTPPAKQVPFKFTTGQGTTSAIQMLIKSTATYLHWKGDYEHKEDYQLKSYWEHVVFAVQTFELSFEPDEVSRDLVDHDIALCVPSLRDQQREKQRQRVAVSFLSKNCRLGGYARKEDLAKALRLTRKKAKMMAEFYTHAEGEEGEEDGDDSHDSDSDISGDFPTYQ